MPLRENLTTKAVSKVSNKAVSGPPGKIRVAVKLPALFENRGQMEQRSRYCPGRRRSTAGMDYQWGSIAVESGVQQVHIRQHYDQQHDCKRAEQDRPGERTDLSMAHNT
jgi:hypothetical protein